MSSTALLLLGPMALFIPVLLLRRFRLVSSLLTVLALAAEAYGCFRLPPDAGLELLGQVVSLGEAGHLALSWVAGASALLALAQAVFPHRVIHASLLLPLVSIAGLALAVEPLSLALPVLWLAVCVSVFLFVARRGSFTRVFRFPVLTALALPAFLVAFVLLRQTPLANPDQPPPWGAIALLLTFGGAAYLSLFPFHAGSPALGESGSPLAAGWALGVLQPIALITLARTLAAYPELAAQPAARQAALIIGAASAVVGAVFASSANRAGRMLGYTAIPAMGGLYAALAAGAARTPFFWMGVFGYSAGVILASIGLAGMEGKEGAGSISDWAGMVYGRGASLALLLAGAWGLCGLPAGIGFWAHRALLPVTQGLSSGMWLVLLLAPLAAAFGWGRALWVAARRGGASVSEGIAARAFAWALALLALMTFIWPMPLIQLGEAFARAFGSQ